MVPSLTPYDLSFPPKRGFHMPPTYANGHISATGDAIHFMFGSRVGFSVTADLTALFTVRTNPRWRPPPSWIISNGHISQQLTIYLYRAHRAVIFAIAQLSCTLSDCRWRTLNWKEQLRFPCGSMDFMSILLDPGELSTESRAFNSPEMIREIQPHCHYHCPQLSYHSSLQRYLHRHAPLDHITLSVVPP